jgi:hypothetical protein
VQYKNLMQLMQEMKDISSFPFGKLPESEEARVGNNWDLYIENQKAYYANQWFVNWTRRKQAENLFTDLKSKRPFLEKLNAILSAQRNIFENDQKAGCIKKNKKGYSRLLDITVSIFVKLVSDSFLQNFESFSLEDKKQLNTLLETQFNFILKILKEKLPLKSPLGAVEFSLDSPRKFFDELNHQRNAVPKHLHYLLDQLVCFAPLFDHLNHNRGDAPRRPVLLP